MDGHLKQNSAYGTCIKFKMKNLKIFLSLFLLILLFVDSAYAAKSMAKQVEDKMGLDEDATLQEKVDSIGQRIAAVCNKKGVVYTFKVLKGDDINAFALPDGNVYIFRGLIDKTSKDDEIAAVLAHEVGHITAGHHEERLKRSLLANIFRIISVSQAATIQDKVNINNAVVELTLSYSREEEIEADRLSAIYLKRAGFDPTAVVSMIEILIKSEMKGPIQPYHGLQTHPYLTDRIRAAHEEISGNIEFMDYANTPTHGIER